MEHTLVLVCCITGCAALLFGFLTYLPLLRSAPAADILLDVSPVLVAASIAVFSMEHFFAGPGMAEMIPPWLPFHLFWVYAVGAGLFAVAVSFVSRRWMPQSALLLTVIFALIVLTVHVPNIWAHWKERPYWNVLARDTLFFASSLVFTSALWPRTGASRNTWPVTAVVGALVTPVLLFFAVEYFLFPKFAPGIPLPKETPAWVPLPRFWAYLTGAAYLATAVGLLREQYRKWSVLLTGGLLLGLTVLLYLPILVGEFGSPQTLEGINYVFDTMLASGCVLFCGWRGAREPNLPTA